MDATADANTRVIGASSVSWSDGSNQILSMLFPSENPSQEVRAFEMKAQKGYQGAVCGIHIGDDPAKIMTDFGKSSEVVDNGARGGMLKFPDGWSFGWWNDENGRIKMLTLWNGKYITERTDGDVLRLKLDPYFAAHQWEKNH